MKQIELWQWRYYDPVRRRTVKTRHKCAEADPEWQDAERVEGSLEVREYPETDAEFEASSTSAFTRKRS